MNQANADGRPPRRMVASLFASAIDGAFRRRADGGTSVHPWPWSSRSGRMLPDAAAELKLRGVMWRWLFGALPIFLLLGAMNPHAMAAMACAYATAYCARMMLALRGMPEVDSGLVAIPVRPGISRPAQTVPAETRS